MLQVATHRPSLLVPIISPSLRAYFASGWAFLVPYLLAYLLYALMKWPTNPVSMLVAGNEERARGWIPPLLHVFWGLHALHAVCAAVALRSWWGDVRNASPQPSITARLPLTHDPSTVTPRQATAATMLRALAPWFFLALLFYIPGVYLEWPSDPWEHLRRINEWQRAEIVTAHSTWTKSAYFTPYSLLSWCIGLRQLFWLDFYYTGVCLLLCWQYYKLARACSLGERASMVFVIIQAMLFGNNIFSFYRYYGISSTIYAQIGGIALIRFVLELVSQGTRLDRRLGKQKLSAQRRLAAPTAHSNSAGQCSAFTAHRFTSFLRPVSCFLLLLLIIAYNHPQGIGIATLGIGSVVGWRLVEWRRSALWWLAAFTIVVNMTFLWAYPRPPVVELYRSQGWLNAYYGFNLLNLIQPAGKGMLQIIGTLGLTSAAISLVLWRKNHIIAWITVFPLLALQCPVVAVNLAHAVSLAGGESYIITFQRMLFSIPSLLAIILVAQRIAGSASSRGAVYSPINSEMPARDSGSQSRWRSQVVIWSGLTGLLIIPAGTPSYNRFWHSVAIVADDLQLRPLLTHYESLRLASKDDAARIVTTQAGAALLFYGTADIAGNLGRSVGLPPSNSLSRTFGDLGLGFKSSADLAAYVREHQQSTMHGAPLTLSVDMRDPHAWITVKGLPPQTVSAEYLGQDTPVIQNPPGDASWIFTAPLMPVTSLNTYRIKMVVRQIQSSGAPVTLAVAWYDNLGRHLDSYRLAPAGAGNPHGWSNGTYSYFGLVEESPPPKWMEYSTYFGLYCPAHVPPNAHYMRAGILLNHDDSSQGVAQLAVLQLSQEPIPKHTFVGLSPISMFSAGSQAGLQSGHWPSNQVAYDSAGEFELFSALTIVQKAHEQ